jgi:phage terminase large subunit-like protein
MDQAAPPPLWLSGAPAIRQGEYAPGFVYDESRALAVEDFIESLCCLTKDSPGGRAGEPVRLLDWHRYWLIRPVFGWREDTDDRLRRYRVVYIEVPKKNAKSSALAWLGTYMLIGDDEPGALGCIAAKTRGQASIIFNEMADMIVRSPALDCELEVVRSTKTIYHRASGSSMSVISRDAGSAEGPSYSFVFFDELHTQSDRLLWDSLRYSGRSRRHPLLITITTAGSDRQSLCWEQHEYAEQCIVNPAYDPRFYGKIYGPKEGADYFDPAVWRECNPGMGITMTEESFAADALEAKNKPTKLNGWLRRSLGVWTESTNRWIAPEKWADCSDRPGDLTGRTCVLGMDLSKRIDFSAASALFPNEDGTFDIEAMLFMPKERIAERERTDHLPYSRWVEEGWILATDGDVIDHGRIREWVLEYSRSHKIEQIVVDITGATQLAVELQGEGLDVKEYPQGFRAMSSPTKRLEALVLEKKIRHGGNPALAAQAAAVTIESNAFEDIRPVKKRSTGRIDGIVALIFALGWWEREQIVNKAPKSKPGIIVL